MGIFLKTWGFLRTLIKKSWGKFQIFWKILHKSVWELLSTKFEWKSKKVCGIKVPIILRFNFYKCLNINGLNMYNSIWKIKHLRFSRISRV